MSARDLLASAFLAPAAPTAPAQTAQTPAAGAGRGDPAVLRVAVLGPAPHATALAAAIANEVRRRQRTSAATVLVWQPGCDVKRRPATPAARRLERRLGARDLDAAGFGHLVAVQLAGESPDAVREIRRAWPVIDVPCVLAYGTPRAAERDELLPEHDLVVLCASTDGGPGSAVRRLAEADLAMLPAPVVAVPPLSTAVTRVCARAGVGRARGLASTFADVFT